MSSDLSVLVLGLDGATLDLVLPWAAQGRLPCLQGLLAQGCHGSLESTIPPITPCAWSSFMTGLNPGKHGLFDFVEPTGSADGGYRYTNATSRSGETVWGILSRLGHRVGVVNVPMTYPPEQVDGFMISGLDTPHDHSAFMHPASLKQELKSAGIQYQIDIQHLGNMCTDARRKKQLNDIWQSETERANAFVHLSNQYPADFRMIVFGSTDQVQHHFWHYMDPAHDKYDAEGAALFSNAILDTYKHVDSLLAQILDNVSENTVVIVMSDHGFGPTSNVRVRLNQALENHDLLTYVEERQTGRVKKTLAGMLDGILRRTLSSNAKRTIAGLLPGVRVWFEKLDEYQIDWSRTTAFVNESFRASPAVWVQGVDENEREQALQQIESILSLLIDPQTGEPAISEVYRTRDLYHGPFADQAPDLLPSWWEDGFLLENSLPAGELSTCVERSLGKIQGGVEFAGSHRIDGTFIIAGGPVKPGAVIEDASIVDVAPTILHLMGHEVPAEMDGKVLTDAFTNEFNELNPVQTCDEAHEAVGPQYQAYSDQDSQIIAERLKALGYIE